MATVVLASTLPASAGTPPLRCGLARFTTAFSRDRLVFCFSGDGQTPATVRTSHNRGTTWDAARRVDPAAAAYAINLVVSPAFATDRTMWALTNNGWFVSRDQGHTFANIDATPVAHPRTDSAYAETSGPVLISLSVQSSTPPAGFEYRTVGGQVVRQPLAGVPDAYAEALLLPPEYGSDGVARIVASSFASQKQDQTGLVTDGVTVRECRAVLVCGTTMFHAGDGQELVDIGQIGSGENVLSTADYQTREVRVFRGRGWGATWTRWPSLEKYLAPIARVRNDVPSIVTGHLAVSAAPDHRGRLFALIQNDAAMLDGSLSPVSAREKLPAYQLLRSDDDGAHWTRIAISYSPLQHASGTARLPWNQTTNLEPSLVAQPGNRLYVVAAHSRKGRSDLDYIGLFTSADGGAHWRRAMP